MVQAVPFALFDQRLFDGARILIASCHAERSGDAGDAVERVEAGSDRRRRHESKLVGTTTSTPTREIAEQEEESRSAFRSCRWRRAHGDDSGRGARAPGSLPPSQPTDTRWRSPTRWPVTLRTTSAFSPRPSPFRSSLATSRTIEALESRSARDCVRVPHLLYRQTLRWGIPAEPQALGWQISNLSADESNNGGKSSPNSFPHGHVRIVRLPDARSRRLGGAGPRTTAPSSAVRCGSAMSEGLRDGGSKTAGKRVDCGRLAQLVRAQPSHG